MPLSPSDTRALLDRIGRRPRRSWGQNFLIDGNLVRKSVAWSDIRPGSAILEIGPGLGTLTRALLEAGARVWAVEIDPVLSTHLRETLGAEFPESFHVLEGDAIQFPRGSLPSEVHKFQVAANLPYAISTPWIEAILEPPLPNRLVLMLQKEAADRFISKPGTKQFGAISVQLQAAYLPTGVHRVSPGCFYPKPEVESVLLQLNRRPDPVIFSSAARALLRAVFGQRRKQLFPWLRRNEPLLGTRLAKALSKLGVTPTARAEEVPAEIWTTAFASIENVSKLYQENSTQAAK